MNFRLLVLCFLLACKPGFCQLHDANWLLGGSSDSSYSNVMVSFLPSTSPVCSSTTGYISLNFANACISDEWGNFLFSTNGIHLYDKNYSVIPNAILHNQFSSWYLTNNVGLNRPQQFIFIPFPGDTNKYILFYCIMEIALTVGMPCGGGWSGGGLPQHLYYVILDKQLNNGMGGVYSASNIALTDTLSHGGAGLAVVKHGNGRDWWVLTKKACSSMFHRVLITPYNIQFVGTQDIGPIMSSIEGGVGGFSPDGSIYYTINSGYEIQLYKFDRCSGMLSDHQTINTVGHRELGEFSANSRFFYTYRSGSEIIQYDLQNYNISGAIQASETIVGVSDTIYCSAVGASIYQYLVFPRLALNNKIYIGASWSCNFLSTIDQPDSLGLLSNVLLHNINLPGPNAANLPFFPNYRLSAMPNTDCDSLTSVGLDDNIKNYIKIYPNPALNTINIKSADLNLSQLLIYNELGQLISSSRLINKNTIDINMSDFPKGILIFNLQFENGQRSYHKIIKL
jgi:hypothetical protein